jgi:hypothetical protein
MKYFFYRLEKVLSFVSVLDDQRLFLHAADIAKYKLILLLVPGV